MFANNLHITILPLYFFNQQDYLSYFQMPRGKSLSEQKKGQIIAYQSTGMTNKQIATKISRCHVVVNNFLKNPESYGTKKCGGHKPKLKPRDKRRIVAAASNSTISCRSIK